jgi:hypothetical protein
MNQKKSNIISNYPLNTFGMKQLISLAFSVFLLAFVSVEARDTSGLTNFPGGRIALSFDGNQHDPDDIVAMPISLALIDAAGLKDAVVHVEHSNHVCDNNPRLHNAMITSAAGMISMFNYSPDVIFDYQKEGEAATANFIRVINESTDDNKLWIIAAGPMETIFRAMEGADKDKLRHVVVISHSTWNQNHGCCGDGMSRRWVDLKESFESYGTFFVGSCGRIDQCTEEEFNDPRYLMDQNYSKEEYDFNTDPSYWEWLRDSEDYRMKWLFSRNPFNPKFDPSDAGMVYFLISGGPWDGGCKNCGWPEAKELLLNPDYLAQEPIRVRRSELVD